MGLRRGAQICVAVALLRLAGCHIFNVSLTAQHDRGAIIEHIRSERTRRNGDFSVIDIGAMGNPWSVQSGVVDAVADLHAHHMSDCWDLVEKQSAEACCRWPPPKPPWPYEQCFDKLHTREQCCRDNLPRPRVIVFPFDVTDPNGWKLVYDYVEKFGRFDIAICSHVLEDIIDPRVVVQALPRVAKEGWIAMPSKFSEFRVGHEFGSAGVARPYRGSIHHRWIYTIRNGTLLAVPKLPVLDSDTIYDDVQRIGDTSIEQLSFWWRDGVPFKLLNNGYLGPSIEDVVRMLRDAIGPSASDDVNSLARVES